MRTEKFISGIALLGLAVLLVLSKLSIVSFHFRIWTVIFTIFLGYTLIRGLIHRRLTESIFSIAFLCILYASQLGIQKLGTWTILATALLINIGLFLNSLLSGPVGLEKPVFLIKRSILMKRSLLINV